MVKPATAADIANVGFGSRGLVIETVSSADGTTIAFEKSGDGPPVVVLGGGLNDKAMFATLAELLSGQFTVFNYDRRGRGDSGDGDPEQYSIDREVEDLAAVLDAAGESSSVFANCTGGMIAIRAATQGVPMARLALYEPPYSAPKTPDGVMRRVKNLVAEGRRGEAVTLFQKQVVRFSDEMVEKFKKHPAWEAFEALAPTIVYDGVITDEHGSIPFGLLRQVTAATLVISGSASPPWIQESCETLSEGIPLARHVSMPGEGHLFNQRSGAPLLTEFFRS